MANDVKTNPPAKATLVVLTYNHEAFIRPCIASALAQDYGALEIIIWDNCSTDRTVEIIDELLAAYDGPHQITFHKSDKNHFPGFAPQNQMFREAKGRYIAILSGDDAMMPNRVSRTVEAFEASGAGAVACSTIDIDEEGRQVGLRDRMTEGRGFTYFSTAADFIRLMGSAVAYGPGIAFRRDVYSRFGKLREGSRNADVNIAFRGALLGGNFYIREPLVYRRLHADNIDMSEKMKKAASEEDLLLLQERSVSNRTANLMAMRDDLLALTRKSPEQTANELAALLPSLDDWIIKTTRRWVRTRKELMLRGIGIV